jgi:class 3 adenylate cyclase
MENTKRQSRVMVVDSHQESSTVLTRILESAGFSVTVASDAEQALTAAEDAPDAFIIDVEMPDIDGIELCQHLRNDARYRFTPIIMTTGLEQGAILRRAFAAGCDDFLHKPLEPVVVIARLTGQLQKYKVFSQLDRVRRNLARYISPRLRRLIEQSSTAGDQLPPLEREVCILFSDIRGFTALSQTIPPPLLFSTISRQLGEQVEVVYRHRGYVDKFGGDGIMAVFDGERMAWDACCCALEIMRLSESAQQHDEPPMPVGIGIHLGAVVEGNIGSGEHLDYSVIGNTVNLAARLCGYAHSRDIIVSENVRAAVDSESGLRFVEPQQARIRGLHSPIRLYRLLGPGEPEEQPVAARQQL